MEVKVGLQTQIPLFPIAHKKNVSALLRVCVCLTENFILYAFTAAADLKDLTAFIMMMNKSKVFEEKGSLWFFKTSKSAAAAETFQFFLPCAPSSELH